MRIIYTRHARQRMKQRKVSEEQVEETLAEPDEVEKQETMQIDYDPQADAIYIRLRNGEVDDTQ
jgi:hypothetical protein